MAPPPRAPSLLEQEPRPVSSPTQSRTALPTDPRPAASAPPNDDDDPERQPPSAADPVWLRESAKGFRWRWAPLPLRKAARFVARWSRGPAPPQVQRIRPRFPAVQAAPAKLVRRFLPTRVHKAVGLAALYVAWLVPFVVLVRKGAAEGNIEGWGVPTPIWCGASLWYARSLACSIGERAACVRE